MAAWREHTACCVATLWRLHRGAVAWQQQCAVAALSALWLHAAARRQQRACQLRTAHYMLRGTRRYLVAWRVAARQRAAVQRMARRNGAAAGAGRSQEARALLTWRRVCEAAVRVRALTSLVLRCGAGRGLNTWRAAAAERSRRHGAARRCAAAMVLREVGAALRSWASWRAARVAARAVAAHALQRLLRAREARALAAWREAAVEAGARRRVVRGAVRRVQHAARARAWHCWAQARQRVHRLRALALRAFQLSLVGALLAWRAAVAHRRAPPTAHALQRLCWPDLAAAFGRWARGARAAARKRAFARRVSAALLHRHAAPALHTWAHACRRRGARRAAARAAARGVALGQMARALLAWQASSVRVLQLTLLRHSASLALRGFGCAAAMRQWLRHATRAKVLRHRRADATRYAPPSRLPPPKPKPQPKPNPDHQP